MKNKKFLFISFLFLFFIGIGNVNAAQYATLQISRNSSPSQDKKEYLPGGRNYEYAQRLREDCRNGTTFSGDTDPCRRFVGRSPNGDIDGNAIYNAHYEQYINVLNYMKSQISDKIRVGMSTNELLDLVKGLGGGFTTSTISGNNILVGCGNVSRVYVSINEYGNSDSNNTNIVNNPISLSEPTYSYGSRLCSNNTVTKVRWSDCNFVNFSGDKLICRQTASHYTENISSSYDCGSQPTKTNDTTGVVTGDGGCDTSNCRNTDATGGVRNGQVDVKNFLLQASNNTYSNAYANAKDINTLNIIVSGTTNGNNSITNILNTFGNFDSNLKSDIIGNTGTNPLIIYGGNPSFNSTVSGNGILSTLKISSTTPLYTNKGQIKFTLGGQNVLVNNVKLNYKKPYYGEIKVKDPSTLKWNGKTTLGTELDYNISIKKDENANIFITGSKIIESTGINGKPNVASFESKIKEHGLTDIDIKNIKIQSISASGSTMKSTLDTDIMQVLFKARINTAEKATVLVQKPGLKIDKPTISYNLSDRYVRYYLSGNSDADNLESILSTPPITTEGEEFLGIRVLGGLQGAGNSEFTGQNKNYSNIAPIESRLKIRKNAYESISTIKSGQVINGVKYIDGTKKLDGKIFMGNNLDFDTLVVKNGNLIIDKNFNVNNDKLIGIIVLADNYNVKNGFSKVGNVYVTPNVTKINAIIYADGGFISVDKKGDLFTSDSPERTNTLNKQLLMIGTLFTRNTIGGAVTTENSKGLYTLPGGSLINNFNTALQYDLNYIRRGKDECEKEKEQCIYRDPFILKYDDRIQTIPPKLFSY